MTLSNPDEPTGTPFNAPPPPTIPYRSAPIPNVSEGAILDGTGTVKSDIPCRKCGYNLRGLNSLGRCPECGTPVGLSVQGDLLRFADPNWLMTLRKGVNFILIGLLVTVIVVFVAGLLQRVLPPVVVQTLALGASVLMIIGGWLLTEPDPSGLGEEQYGTARKLIRIALIVGAANSLLSVISSLATFDPAVFIAVAVVSGLAGLVGVAGQVAQLNYLGKLAMRIPDLALAARARFLMWAIGVSYGALLALGLIIAVLVGSGGLRGGSFGAVGTLGCAAVIAVITLLVFGIMYLIMLSRFGKQFEQQAALARHTWGTSAVPAT
jgi:hypothetical protein